MLNEHIGLSGLIKYITKIYFTCLFLLFYFFVFFFGLPVEHRVPRPGFGSEPELQPKLQLGQRWILNPLCAARDRTRVPEHPSIPLHHSENPSLFNVTTKHGIASVVAIEAAAG